MLKHSECLSTIEQELFPGVREETDTRRWLLRKWAFAVVLSAALVYWSGALWQAGGQQVENIAGKSSLQKNPQHRFLARTTQALWIDNLRTSISDTAKTSMVIPKGTVIPVKIESTQLGGLGQTVIRARTRSYVFPDKAVLIPAGSRVEGMAKRRGGKWEIHWNSVSVVSVDGQEADIQAMNRIPGKANLYGRSLLIRVN